MAYPTACARTKNWGTEVLTDTDLEGQFDLIIDWINEMADASSGHKHDGTTSEGPKIATLASSVSGDITFTGAISFSKTPTIPATAPTNDTDIANKKYVDDQITANAFSQSDITAILGDWSDKSSDYDSQEATTDGFVQVYLLKGTGDSVAYSIGYTDSSNPPTTARVKTSAVASASTHVNFDGGFMMTVKKGDYWKVTNSGGTQTVYWIPLAS